MAADVLGKNQFISVRRLMELINCIDGNLKSIFVKF